MKKLIYLFSLTYFLVLLTPYLMAETYTIYVAPKKTAAYTAAKAKENNTSVFAERKFSKGLAKAAQLLQSGAHTVNVLVAHGQYKGKVGSGVLVLPAINNPGATLRLAGGFNDDFSARQPFKWLTELVTIDGRDGALLQISKRSALKELVVTGFHFDAAPSNKYDKKTNSILKGQSRTYPLISFSMLRTDHLVVDSNIFINGAHGAFDPYVAPASANTVVDITNNFFVNNIKAIQIGAGVSSRGNTVKEVNLRNNSFLLNWPYNPDPTSSNVSAVNLYHSEGAQNLNIESNIFAFNPGGAFQHDWPEERMPDIVLSNNLFHMNAALFKEGNSEAGVIAGKFGTNPRYLILDIETVEDDLDYDVEGNVTFDPKIPIALADLQAADSYSVQRQNTTMNDIRRLFGLNQSGGTVAIANYAPMLVFDAKALPFPNEEKAKTYGVQPGKLWSPKSVAAK